MRGAFYVTTALFIANSIRTAAEADRSAYRQRSYHLSVAPGIMDATNSSPNRFLRGSREQHGDLAISAADEERMPEASTKVIGNTLTSSSEEALSAVRKATHLSFDLNAPPEETATGAMEAYNIVRNKGPQAYSVSNSEVSSSRLRKKRTAQALSRLDKASSSANPKKRSGGQPKKLRTSAPLEATEIQSSISRDKMALAPITLSDDSVQHVHNLYLEHLKRNSAGFKPTKDETRKMLDQVNQARNANPILSNSYTQYVKNLMIMHLEALKELGLNSATILEPNLRALLERTSEDLEEIQLRLLRLLCLRRWMHMYRDFFYFCLLNHEICSNFRATSTLQQALQWKDKFAEFSVEVAPSFAVLGTKNTRSSKAERDMFKDVMAAAENSNLEEEDKKLVYTTLEEVSRDDYQLVASGRSAPIDGTSAKRNGRLHYDVLKTPPSSGTNEESPSGGQGRNRKKLFELVQEASNQVKKTLTRYDKSMMRRNDRVKVTQILDTFMEESKLDFAPTHEVIKKMWRLFNWRGRSSNPREHKYAGHKFIEYVCRLNQKKLEAILGSERVNFVKATQHTEAGDAKYLLELRTEYLKMLLETYDKFYPFCQRHRELCKIPSDKLFIRSRRNKNADHVLEETA